jgi:hypothetical protein
MKCKWSHKQRFSLAAACSCIKISPGGTEGTVRLEGCAAEKGTGVCGIKSDFNEQSVRPYHSAERTPVPDSIVLERPITADFRARKYTGAACRANEKELDKLLSRDIDG